MTLDPDKVRSMAESYAEAWCSHSPDAVAAFYDENGRIAINDGDPVIGRAAIREMVQGFYNEFPDLVVKLDKLGTAGNSAVFLWTLEGRHSETGNLVRMSGWEAWRLSDDTLVLESDGRFDAAEYDRQVHEGI